MYALAMFVRKIARNWVLKHYHMYWSEDTEKKLSFLGATPESVDDVEYDEKSGIEESKEESKKLAEEVEEYLKRLKEARRCFDPFDTFGIFLGTSKRLELRSPTEEAGDLHKLLELSVLDVRELAEWLPFIGEVSLRKVESKERGTFAEEWCRLSELVRSIVSKGVNVAPDDVAREVMEKFGLQVLIFRMITEALLNPDKVSEIWTPKESKDFRIKRKDLLFEHGYYVADPRNYSLNSGYVDLMSCIYFIPRKELAEDEDYSDGGVLRIHDFFATSIKDVMCRRCHWKADSGVPPNQSFSNYSRDEQIKKIKDVEGPENRCEALCSALHTLTERRSSLSVRVRRRKNSRDNAMLLWYTWEKLKLVQEKGEIVFARRASVATTITYFYVCLSLALAFGIPVVTCNGEALECIQDGVFIASTLLITVFGIIKLWSDDQRVLHNMLFGRVVFNDLDALLDHFKIEKDQFISLLLSRGIGYPWLSTRNLSMIQSGGDGTLVLKKGITYETLRNYQIAGSGFLSDGRTTRKLEKVSSDLWQAGNGNLYDSIILEEPLQMNDVVV